jgi:pilus assembly protein CpaB
MAVVPRPARHHRRAAFAARLHPHRLRRRLPLALAAAAAVLTLPWLGARAARETTGAQPVLVAAADLSPGAPLGPGDVVRARAPTLLVPADALDEVPATAVVRAPIAAGEVLTARRVGGGRTLGTRLGPDQRAVSLPWPLARPPVGPGDRLDLVGTRVDERTGGARTLVLARDASVLAVDDDGLTVAVPAGLVPAIYEAVAAGVVDLAVTPFSD